MTTAETPNTARVRVTWAGALRFDGGRPGQATAQLDGMAESAPGPLDGLLNALAACSAGDVVSILTQRRTPVERMTVDVIGDRVDTPPRRVWRIALQYVIDGANIERVHAERAVDLALTKYCSVRASLDPAIPIVCTLTLNGEAGKEFAPGSLGAPG
jgi:putative redox protein